MSLMAAFLLVSCGENPATKKTQGAQHEQQVQGENKKDEEPKTEEPKAEVKAVDFSFEYEGEEYKAKVDEMSRITVEAYESPWSGSISVVKYDGPEYEGDTPYNDAHCEQIKQEWANPETKDAVQNAYKTKIKIGMAPFMTEAFQNAAAEAAKKAGFVGDAMMLDNPVLVSKAKAKIEIGANAMLSTGDIQAMETQVDAGLSEVKDGDSLVKLSSGALVCDLLKGDASLSITYPVKNKPDMSVESIFKKVNMAIEAEPEVDPAPVVDPAPAVDPAPEGEDPAPQPNNA